MDVGGSCKNSVDGEPIENVQGSAKSVEFTGHRLRSGSNGESRCLFVYC